MQLSKQALQKFKTPWVTNQNYDWAAVLACSNWTNTRREEFLSEKDCRKEMQRIGVNIALIMQYKREIQ